MSPPSSNPENSGRIFERIKHTRPFGEEYWSARELARALEYLNFRNFEPVIERAREACLQSGHAVADHIAEMRNMVGIGSGAQRSLEDWALSRYACYLIIQNADPSKPLVALGQTYFAVQTRRQELVDDAALKEERTRLLLRADMKKQNKKLAGIARQAGVLQPVNYAVTILTSDQRCWPRQLSDRLGARCPTQLTALGNPALLAVPLTALFCSARCPGEAILRAYDQAAHWRDTGRAVIGGFHSPMEKECLRILLRGPQPIVVCPARWLPARIAPELRAPVAAGRLLVLTPFPVSDRRVTQELAERRNQFVAALADEVWFAHVTPGGQAERLAKTIARWSPISIPPPSPGSPAFLAPFPSSALP